MQIKLAVLTGALALSVATTGLEAQPVPASVLAFEAQKIDWPVPTSGGKHLGGLSLCRLLERGRGRIQPFFALPADLGEDTCDLSDVILAYNGWCMAGVQNLRRPHLTQPLFASVTIQDYDDTTVIYLNLYLRNDVVPTEKGDASALAFINNPPEELDIRAQGVPLFPRSYFNFIPPQPGVGRSSE